MITNQGYFKDCRSRFSCVTAFSAMLILLCMVGCATDSAQKAEQAQVHINIGTAYIEAGDYGSALNELLKAERVTPKDPRIHYFLAVAYQARGYNEKAIDELNVAVGLKENYSEALNFLGTIYLNTGHPEKAIKAFNQALVDVTYETPALPLYNLGRAYQHLGNYPVAMSKYQEAAVKDTRGDILPLVELSMGKTSVAQGDISRAILHFKRAVQLVPSFVEAHYLLGESLERAGNLKEARASFDMVVRLAPSSAWGKQAKAHLSRSAI